MNINVASQLNTQNNTNNININNEWPSVRILRIIILHYTYTHNNISLAIDGHNNTWHIKYHTIILTLLID